MARRAIEDFEEEYEEVFADEHEEDNKEVDMLENDEISPEEEGFMRGAREASDY